MKSQQRTTGTATGLSREDRATLLKHAIAIYGTPDGLLENSRELLAMADVSDPLYRDCYRRGAVEWAQMAVEFNRAMLQCVLAIGGAGPFECGAVIVEIEQGARTVAPIPMETPLDADRELAPGWDRFDTSTDDTKAEDMASTGFLMGRTTETQTDWEEIDRLAMRGNRGLHRPQ